MGRLKNFMPTFINDTKELERDAARKERMNLDMIDEPTGDQKVIEMVNFFLY